MYAGCVYGGGAYAGYVGAEGSGVDAPKDGGGVVKAADSSGGKVLNSFCKLLYSPDKL